MYRMGACKGCKQRREALAAASKKAVAIVRTVTAKVKK